MQSESAVANPFSGKDGLIQLSKYEALQKRIDKEVKAAEDAGTKVKTEVVYVYSAKVKAVNFKASAEKQGDFKHLAMRAFKLGERKRLTTNTLNKNKLLLNVPIKGIVGKDTQKLITAALRGVKSHIAKSEKTRAKITKEKGVIRDAATAAFDVALAGFVPLLIKGGIKEQNIVEASGMFGKTVIVRTGTDSYLSIGKADAKRFRDAKKAAKEAQV